MTDDDPPPLEPTPPDDSACCGSGCEPCVWDLYDAERTRYVEALRAWRVRQAARAARRPVEAPQAAGTGVTDR